MKYVFWMILIVLINGCTTFPKALAPVKENQFCKNENEIYIISHGWHAGLAIKSQDLNEAIPELSVRFPNSQYYEIGWGDSGFYQTNEITIGLTLQAMFYSTGSVIHVVSLNSKPTEIFKKSKVISLKSDNENYNNMINFISSSFKRDQNNEIIYENHGIYGDSQFYTGIGKYHIFNTCNKWTAKALYSAGFDISPILKLTSASVINYATNACSN